MSEKRNDYETWEVKDPDSQEVVYWPAAWRHWRAGPSEEDSKTWEIENLEGDEVVYRPAVQHCPGQGSSP